MKLLGVAALLALFYGAINLGPAFVIVLCGAIMLAAAVEMRRP